MDMEYLPLYAAIMGSTCLFIGLLLVIFSAPSSKSRQDLLHNNVSVTDVLNGRLQKEFSGERLEGLKNGLDVRPVGDGKFEIRANAKISSHAIRRVLRHW